MKSVTEQIEAVLEQFMDREDNEVEKAFNKARTETVKKLKETSPKGRRGDYARGWTSRKGKSSAMGGKYITALDITVYNKTDYQLTHLLERGHVIANQYGTYSRTSGDGHISDAEEFGINLLLSELQRRL